MLGDVIIDLLKCSNEDIRRLKQSVEKGFSCPYCSRELVLKAGTKNKAHFSHLSDCKYTFYERESEEHLQTKLLFTKWLTSQDITAHVEYQLPQIKRIADVYFESGGKKYALEIQKSPLSEREFRERTGGYLSLGTVPIWIFLGDVRVREHATVLASVMTGKNQKKLFHFDLTRKHVTFIEDIVWLTSKEVVATMIRRKLKDLSFEDMLHPANLVDSTMGKKWRAVKKRFRERGWFYFSKAERRLSILCAKKGVSVALLPSEVGWPVLGRGFKKPLFVWQAYIFMSIMAEFSPGDFFTSGDIVRLLRKNFSFNTNSHSMPQLKAYLGWLVRFGILEFSENCKENWNRYEAGQREGSQGYYEVLHIPAFSSAVEKLIHRDNMLVEEFL